MNENPHRHLPSFLFISAQDLNESTNGSSILLKDRPDGVVREPTSITLVESIVKGC